MHLSMQIKIEMAHAEIRVSKKGHFVRKKEFNMRNFSQIETVTPTIQSSAASSSLFWLTVDKCECIALWFLDERDPANI